MPMKMNGGMIVQVASAGKVDWVPRLRLIQNSTPDIL